MHLLEFGDYKVGWVRIAGALHWCPSESCLGFHVEQGYSA